MFQLSDIQIVELSERFKILSEPSRLKILRSLFNGEKNVSDITTSTALNQANVSKQLKLMLDAGILQVRQRGLKRIYKIKDPMVKRLCKKVCESLDSNSKPGDCCESD